MSKHQAKTTLPKLIRNEGLASPSRVRVLPDKGQLCHPADYIWHLLATEQEPAEKYGQQHC